MPASNAGVGVDALEAGACVTATGGPYGGGGATHPGGGGGATHPGGGGGWGVDCCVAPGVDSANLVPHEGQNAAPWPTAPPHEGHRYH
jgi:hypothetical protein